MRAAAYVTTQGFAAPDGRIALPAGPAARAGDAGWASRPEADPRAVVEATPGPAVAGTAASFPLGDLRFVLAWSRVAPGIGGWRVSVVQMATGEMVEVTPPGAEFPLFYVLPRADGVEIIRERVIEVGGGQVSVARAPSLREAALLLCPLHPAQLAELDQALSARGEG